MCYERPVEAGEISVGLRASAPSRGRCGFSSRRVAFGSPYAKWVVVPNDFMLAVAKWKGVGLWSRYAWVRSPPVQPFYRGSRRKAI